jgi:DNA-binding domain/Domain of unknown function (DUF4469) with IG-like fold
MSTNHHSIKAELYPNLLKNNRGTFKAQTIAYQTLGIKDVCNSVSKKPGTGIDADAMEYHVRLFLEEMAELLADGFAVNTGYFAASATVRGSFNNKRDNFDSERHSVTFKFSQGALLRKKAAETQAEILHVVSNRYGIQSVKDNHSHSENELLTAGNALHIKGLKLKLSGNHPDVGVYFISETTGERSKVPTTDVLINQNNHLLIVIPDLKPDTYRLKHITQYAGSTTPLAEARSTTFAPILRVT